MTNPTPYIIPAEPEYISSLTQVHSLNHSMGPVLHWSLETVLSPHPKSVH